MFPYFPKHNFHHLSACLSLRSISELNGSYLVIEFQSLFHAVVWLSTNELKLASTRPQISEFKWTANIFNKQRKLQCMTKTQRCLQVKQ